MSEFDRCKWGQGHKCSWESIMASKVFDQCSLKKCLELGPVNSAEKCSCIILSPDEDDKLGRVILPERPIYLPELVSSVKALNDSLETERIQISGVTPSAMRKCHWDIDIIFTFKFKVQLFDVNMKKLKVLCCPQDCKSLDDCHQIKDYILCSVQYVANVTLYAPKSDMTVAFSGFPIKNEQRQDDPPQVLVESKAYLLDAVVKSPSDPCFSKEVLDGIYDEPVLYIYVRIGSYTVVKLLGLVNVLIELCGYDFPPPCRECGENPCELFDRLEFPEDDFFPSEKRQDDVGDTYE